MKKFTEENPNILGLGFSRRWEGPLVGILVFFLISLLVWGLTPLAFLFFVASILPAALIGSLLISKKMVLKAFGLILLVIFIGIWLYFAFVVNILMD